MTIQHTQSGTKGMFYVARKDDTQAELDYTMRNDQLLVINHTEVDDSLKGQNVGKDLVNAAVEFARKNQLKILPLCTFANALMKRHKAEYADVLKEN